MDRETDEIESLTGNNKITKITYNFSTSLLASRLFIK